MTRRVFIAASALLIATSVAGLAAEGALRAAGPRWLHELMVDRAAGGGRYFGSDVSWPIERAAGRFDRFTPGASFRIYHFEYAHPVHIDARGFRLTPGPRSADAPVLVVAGDSFAFGVGVAEDETFASRLARATGRRVINEGMPGTGLREQLDVVARRHEELGRPDFYLFTFFTGNDWADLVRPEEGVTASAGTGVPRSAQLASDLISKGPLGDLYAVQLAKYSLAPFVHTPQFAAEPIVAAMRRGDTSLSRAAAALDAQLRRLRALSAARGFRFMFAIIPDRSQIYPDVLEARAARFKLDPSTLDPSAPTEAIVAQLRRFGIPHVDLTSCLAGARRDDLYYRVDNHFTAAGHAIAADCIAPALTPLF